MTRKTSLCYIKVSGDISIYYIDLLYGTIIIIFPDQRRMSAMKKVFTKDLLVLELSLFALICAAMSLNSSLNQLTDKEQN